MGEGRSRSRKEQEAEEQQQQQWQLRDLVGAVAAAVAAVGCRSQVRGGASNANSPEQPISQEQPSSYLVQFSLHKQEKRQVTQARGPIRFVLLQCSRAHARAAIVAAQGKKRARIPLTRMAAAAAQQKSTTRPLPSA